MAMSIKSKLESAKRSLANAREKAARTLSESEYKSACIRIKACKTRINNLRAQLAAEAAKEFGAKTAEQNEVLKIDLNNIIALKNDNELNLYTQRFSYLSDDFNAINHAQTNAEANSVCKVIDRFKAEVKRLSPSLPLWVSRSLSRIQQNLDNLNFTSDAMIEYFSTEIDSVIDNFHQNPTLEGGILDWNAPLRARIYDEFIVTAKNLIRANERVQESLSFGIPLEYIHTNELDNLNEQLSELKFNLSLLETFDALMLIKAKAVSPDYC